jgi:hypothetical protein
MNEEEVFSNLPASLRGNLYNQYDEVPQLEPQVIYPTPRYTNYDEKATYLMNEMVAPELKYELFGDPNERNFFGIKGGLLDWLGYKRPQWAQGSRASAPLTEATLGMVNPLQMAAGVGGGRMAEGKLPGDWRPVVESVEPRSLPPPLPHEIRPWTRPSSLPAPLTGAQWKTLFEDKLARGDKVSAWNIIRNAWRSGNKIVPSDPAYLPIDVAMEGTPMAMPRHMMWPPPGGYPPLPPTSVGELATRGYVALENLQRKYLPGNP